MIHADVGSIKSPSHVVQVGASDAAVNPEASHTTPSRVKQVEYIGEFTSFYLDT